MHLVSVIIPTFNRRQPLKNALNSVFAQKGISFEVLVIDDGSTDGTREMIAREFSQVHYFYFENRGPAAARNRGIERAKGDWIAFLDSDDVWKPGKLKAQADFFKRNPDSMIVQTEEIWIRNGRRVNPMKKHKKYGGEIFEKCLALCMVSPSVVMIRRDLFEAVGVFDETLPACEDYDLWLRVAAEYRVGLIEKPYVTRYGGHADQRSRQYPVMDLFRVRALVKLIRSGTLNREQALKAASVLGRKAAIIRQGAEKRGNQSIISELKRITKEELTAGLVLETA